MLFFNVRKLSFLEGSFFLFRGVGWGWVHLVCRPLIDLLYQPRMTNEYGAIDVLRTGSEVPGGNLPQCHFVHHNSRMTWFAFELGPPRLEASAQPQLWQVLEES
jgi:hypothetical protein